MLVITSVKEDLQEVTDIFEKAEIPVFSVSNTIGHKAAHHDYLLTNWFGRDNDQTDALFFFSFTDDEKAYKTLDLIKIHNELEESLFPVRGFILPVESSGF